MLFLWRCFIKRGKNLLLGIAGRNSSIFFGVTNFATNNFFVMVMNFLIFGKDVRDYKCCLKEISPFCTILRIFSLLGMWLKWGIIALLCLRKTSIMAPSWKIRNYGPPLPDDRNFVNHGQDWEVTSGTDLQHRGRSWQLVSGPHHHHTQAFNFALNWKLWTGVRRSLAFLHFFYFPIFTSQLQLFIVELHGP